MMCYNLNESESLASPPSYNCDIEYSRDIAPLLNIDFLNILSPISVAAEACQLGEDSSQFLDNSQLISSAQSYEPAITPKSDSSSSYQFNNDTSFAQLDLSVLSDSAPRLSYVRLTDDILSSSQSSPCSSSTASRGQKRKQEQADLPTAKRLADKKLCLVCGDVSSGFHYGAEVCSACKLFFSRNDPEKLEKANKKAKVGKCLAKNCRITVENRANCTECRYKKCIAVGMSKNKSVFGRQEKTSSHYIPNLSEMLCSLLDHVKSECYAMKETPADRLEQLVVAFYSEVVMVLRTESQIEDVPDNVKLPECVLVLFCVLFNINSPVLYSNQPMVQEFLRHVETITERMFKNVGEFSEIFRIGLMIKLLRVLLEKKPVSGVDPCEARINDLIKSEYYVIMQVSGNSSSSKQPIQQNQLDVNVMFCTLNQLIYRHMKPRELNYILFNELF